MRRSANIFAGKIISAMVQFQLHVAFGEVQRTGEEKEMVAE